MPKRPLFEPPVDATDQAFTLAQREYWRDVDAAHFEWQTRAPYIAESEAALLDRVTVARGGRLLEIGCGEGANLFHLRARIPEARLYGVDFTHAKARFAAEQTGAHTACADASALPFSDGAFDAVLIRDLLHHLPAGLTRRALAEAVRVLRPGGRLFLLEPNGRNPIILAAAAAQPAERGMLASREGLLSSVVQSAGLTVSDVEPRQPLPISRVVLHYKLGAPGLGSHPLASALLAHLEREAARLPRALWAYIFIQGIKP